jgi:hypothetical protein
MEAYSALPRRVLAVTALFAGAIGATGVLAQVPIGQISPEGISIKGKVTDLFGDKFVLEDSSGRILVQIEPGGPQALGVNSGETITAIGQPRDRTFTARRILRENGEVIFTSPVDGTAQPRAADRAGAAARAPISDATAAPLSAAHGFFGSGFDREALTRMLREAGLTAVGEPVRHPKHIEIAARTESGKPVIVSLDRFGRLDEIEDADHDKHRVSETRAISLPDAERLARAAGFSPREPIERRKHHFEIVTTNRKGEIVEVHMDLAGDIYKQVWIR